MREKLIDVFMHLDRHIQNRDEYGICYTSDFVEAVETVLAMLKSQDANGVTVQQWIPASEPPKECGRYYCNVKSHAFPGSFYQDILHFDQYGFHDSGIYTDAVTHWMPLPQPPKEG